jgi:enamine deaminase RidA (YjgF/YER057c/UK114 family)
VGAFESLAALLEIAGCRPDDVGHLFVWYGSHKYREAVNRPWLAAFPEPEDRPARHAIQSELDGRLIAIEVIGVASATSSGEPTPPSTGVAEEFTG